MRDFECTPHLYHPLNELMSRSIFSLGAFCAKMSVCGSVGGWQASWPPPSPPEPVQLPVAPPPHAAIKFVLWGCLGPFETLKNQF